MSKRKTYPWVDAFFENFREFPHFQKVIERLKKRYDEMKDVYAEIEPQMRPLPNINKENSADGVLSAIIDGAAAYSGKTVEGIDKTKAERGRINDLKELHKDMIKQTRRLISLLDRFENKQTEGRILSAAYTNVFHLLKKAGRGDYVFDKKIKPMLDAAEYQGFEHNPNLQDLLESLMYEIQDAEVYPRTDEDAAALYFQKTELAFVRFFLTRLNKEKGIIIPENLSLSNESIVTIARCALDLPDKALYESQISTTKSKIKIFLD